MTVGDEPEGESGAAVDPRERNIQRSIDNLLPGGLEGELEDLGAAAPTVGPFVGTAVTAGLKPASDSSSNVASGAGSRPGIGLGGKSFGRGDAVVPLRVIPGGVAAPSGGGGPSDYPGISDDAISENAPAFGAARSAAELSERAAIGVGGRLELGDSGEPEERSGIGGGLVTARGTTDGFVLRVDGRADVATLRRAIKEFLSLRRSFIAGNEISLEWTFSKPDDHRLNEIVAYLSNDFAIRVKSSRLREPTRNRASSPGEAPPLARSFGSPAEGERSSNSVTRGVTRADLLERTTDGATIPSPDSERSGTPGGGGTAFGSGFEKNTAKSGGASAYSSGSGLYSSGSGAGAQGFREGQGVREAGSRRSASLFDGIEVLGGEGRAGSGSTGLGGSSGGVAMGSSGVASSGARDMAIGSGRMRAPADGALWDDPDARAVYNTVRSGQKVESEHTLIICGDVNSGAELVAGGDIIVLGTLRGVAHAGAYDETGGGRFIFALSLQPTQLRIGSVISRGSTDNRAVPEIARVDSGLIVVEPYQPRHVLGRKL